MVAWSVATVEVCLMRLIGSPREKVAAFRNRFVGFSHVQSAPPIT